ncbi:ninjurin-1 [Trichonephila inaurata madagascariensis]|uniref:Ninjurin-1 n=1 Tax=Trichonephila inaurata madagascariensis TaxID=2747483 RepID=A0A8X7CQJ3_9ARAC|nr:ninjurin-1 [Trichonephila inaurata madagascariensis]
MQCRRGDVVCNALSYIKKLKFCTYCRRKAYAQMSMDIALVVTNVAHLTKILRGREDDEMRFIKIILVAVGIGILLCFKERYDIDEEKNQRFMTIMNDVVVFMIFASVLVHVFVAVFVEEHHIPSHALARYYGNCSASH